MGHFTRDILFNAHNKQEDVVSSILYISEQRLSPGQFLKVAGLKCGSSVLEMRFLLL